MGSRRRQVTVTLSRGQADALYAVAVRAEEDRRWFGGRERRALGRALDNLARARRAAEDDIDGSEVHSG